MLLVAPENLPNRLRFTAALPSTAFWGFGDLLIDAAQGASDTVVAVLVLHDPVGDAAGFFAAAGRPGLGQDQPVGNILVGKN